jgi:hypothetical protein
MAAAGFGACTIPTNVSTENRRRKTRQFFSGLLDFAIAPQLHLPHRQPSYSFGPSERETAPRRGGPCLCCTVQWAAASILREVQHSRSGSARPAERGAWICANTSGFRPVSRVARKRIRGTSPTSSHPTCGPHSPHSFMGHLHRYVSYAAGALHNTRHMVLDQIPLHCHELRWCAAISKRD